MEDRKVVKLGDAIYYVEEGRLLRVPEGGEFFEIQYKMWCAVMDQYISYKKNVGSTDIVDGVIYTITGKSIQFV